MAPFSIVGVFDEVDDTLYAFEQLHHEILNEQAPYTIYDGTMAQGNNPGGGGGLPYETDGDARWKFRI